MGSLSRRGFLKNGALGLAFVPFCRANSEASDEGTHIEVTPIGSDRFGDLTTFCLTKEGRLLACDAKHKEIKVLTQNGAVLSKWSLEFSPHAIHASSSGEVIVAGIGIVAKLNSNGKLLKMTKSGGTGIPKTKVSGISDSDDHVFVAFGTNEALRSRSTIVRLSRNLERPEIIAKDLRGCHQRLDMVVEKGILFVAENARHRVAKLDFNGKLLGNWGEKNRDRIEGFQSCCNPMNLCFNTKGELYTGESGGLGRIKRYTPDGRFLGLVGYVGSTRFNRAGRESIACSNMTVAVTKDESRIFVLDIEKNLIRVLEKKTDLHYHVT